LEAVHATVEAELGQPVTALFAQFDEVPLACASIGQVHRAAPARRRGGRRQGAAAGIDKKMRIDLEILAGLAQLAERVPDFQELSAPSRPLPTSAARCCASWISCANGGTWNASRRCFAAIRVFSCRAPMGALHRAVLNHAAAEAIALSDCRR